MMFVLPWLYSVLLLKVMTVNDINFESTIAKSNTVMTEESLPQKVLDCTCHKNQIKEYKNLRGATKKLSKQIEIDYGKEVCVVEISNWGDPFKHGEACITQDGIPVIRINPKTDDKNRTITHELFHLKLRVKGFPDFVFYYPNIQLNTEVMLSITGTFLETVEHYLFFDSMRKMGIDPVAHLKLRIKSEDYKEKDLSNFREMVYYYFNAKLLVDDTRLVEQLRSWYESNGLQKALSKGDELVAILQQSKPKTPDEQVSAVVSVLNSISDNKARFSFYDWKERRLGAVNWRRAVILIEASD